MCGWSAKKATARVYLKIISNDVCHLCSASILTVDNHKDLMYPSASLLCLRLHEIVGHVLLNGDMVIDELVESDDLHEGLDLQIAGTIVMNRVSIFRGAYVHDRKKYGDCFTKKLWRRTWTSASAGLSVVLASMTGLGWSFRKTSTAATGRPPL